MNPKIKELASQAGLSHMPSEYPDMADLYKGADFELEKFAELIVKECAKVAYKYTNKTETHELYDEVGWDCLPGDLKIQIEEHFGVGE